MDRKRKKEGLGERLMSDEVGVKTRIVRRTWQLKVGHGKQPHKQDKQTNRREKSKVEGK